MKLETERLFLRDYELGDAPFFLKLLNDPSFLKNIGDRNVRTLEDAENYVQNRIEDHKKKGFSYFLVLVKKTQELAGIVGFLKRDYLEEVDVGFAFLPEYTGKGFAYEASEALLKFGKENLKLKKIQAITALENEPSIRLVEKLGLRFLKMIEVPGKDREKVRLFERTL